MLIGEVARRSGVSARMLRHYDELGLVRPSGRTANGYRDYTEADVRALLRVELLRSLGLTLGEIGQTHDDPSFSPTDLVGDLLVRIRERIAREQELLSRLEQVAGTGPADWTQVLDAVALLRELGSPVPADRQRAALTVGLQAPPIPALVDALLIESAPNVVGALQWAIVRGGDEAAPALAAALESPELDGAARERLMNVLAELPGPASAAALTGVLEDAVASLPSLRVRAAIALAGRHVVSARVVETLIDAVADGVNDVEAAESLGRLTERDVLDASEVVDALAARLTPPVPAAVTARIAQALGELPKEARRPILGDLASSDDPATAWTARSLLRD